MKAPIGPPTIGAAMYTQALVNAAVPHPKKVSAIRGPKSRAGLMPDPVRLPNMTIIEPIAIPTMGAIAPEGTLFLGLVTAKMQNVKNAVPNASMKKA